MILDLGITLINKDWLRRFAMRVKSRYFKITCFAYSEKYILKEMICSKKLWRFLAQRELIPLGNYYLKIFTRKIQRKIISFASDKKIYQLNLVSNTFVFIFSLGKAVVWFFFLIKSFKVQQTYWFIFKSSGTHLLMSRKIWSCSFTVNISISKDTTLKDFTIVWSCFYFWFRTQLLLQLYRRIWFSWMRLSLKHF